MDKAILYPMFALAFWTFGVLLLIPIVRFKSVFARHAKASDFKLGETESLPDYVKLPNRNYMNLLEMPILFYVVSLVFYITNSFDKGVIALAWAYFGLRVIHSLIHLNGNNVRFRLVSFAISNFVLIALWVFALLKI